MANRTKRILEAAKRIVSSEEEVGDEVSNSLSSISGHNLAGSSNSATSKTEIKKECLYRVHSFGSSDEESDPFEDSGDSSYRPSDDEQANDENDDDQSISGSSSDNDEDQATGPVSIAPTSSWGPCGSVASRFQFSAQNVQLNNFDSHDAYSIYRHFIDNEILDLIVKETNRYAAQFISNLHQLSRRSLARKWRDTNKDEIRKLLGILIVMGINHLPKLRLYWSNNKMYKNDLIKDNMTRDRFDLLMKFLHFSNNEAVPDTRDRLIKIREILELICNNFQKILKPQKDIVIDETMVPWRGRLVFRQYLPAKSHKYGIKIYKVCTPDGYTYNLSIYCGKNDNTVHEHGHTFDVTLKLMQGLLDEGRVLYIDNFYTSVKLSEFLLHRKTYVCGTLRTNRKDNPKDVCKKKLKKGEIYGQENKNGVRVFKWQDKRPVLMISTVPHHMDELIPTGLQNRKGEDIMKPRAVMDYNRAKKGVDVSDQMSSYYTALRKTIKWYKKAILEIVLGTCIVNSWVIYNKNRRKKKDILNIREELIDKLLDNEETSEVDDDQDIEPTRGRASKICHKLNKFEGTARKNRKRCSLCYEKIQRERGTKEARLKAKRVMTYCNNCDGKPPMCLSCFNQKH